MSSCSDAKVARRVLIEGDPFAGSAEPYFWGGVKWPAQWIGLAGEAEPPFVSVYRCVVEAETAQTVRVHVSADERYELFVDGQRIGRGSERGDALRWRFETYDLALSAGRHAVVARVWAFGQAGHRAPAAQVSVRPSFLLAAEGALGAALSTGHGAWEAKLVAGHFCDPPDERNAGYYAGGTERIDGRVYPWGVERGEGGGWGPAKSVEGAQMEGFEYSHSLGRHVLTPAKLPAMMERATRAGRVRFTRGFDCAVASTESLVVREAEHDAAMGKAWQAMVEGGAAVEVAANACVRVVLDLEDYYCGYPDLVVSGGAGASVRVDWAESLYLPFKPGQNPNMKGNRGEVEGKVFRGRGDTFVADGGAARGFAPLWWRAGRYVEVVVRTGEEAVVLDSLSFRETRYPLVMDYELETSDGALDAVGPLMIRALTTGMHETYVDCPYYEQLQYVGDTRLECLTTYVISGDDRLPRQAILAYHGARCHDGLTPSRYPCHDPQAIPGFSLWWIGMVHDFMMWRDDEGLVREVMPTVRSVVEVFLSHRQGEGLVGAVAGWNFVDWVEGWEVGTPPSGQTGVSAIINWQLVMVLGQVAELEDFVGEEYLAERCRSAAVALSEVLCREFFVESRGLFADDAGGEAFSEHAQALALLSGRLGEARERRVLEGLLNEPGLSRMTIYFSHYLFEVCHRFGVTEPFFSRMEELWLSLPGLGVKTLLESPEPARSDNHGWGAHPLFHQFATLLGIRPASPGFGSVRITPQLGRLKRMRGVMPTVRGAITADLRREGERLVGTVVLPAGLSGELVVNGGTQALVAGENVLGG